MPKLIQDRFKFIFDPQYKVKQWQPSKNTIKKRIQSLQIKKFNTNTAKWTEKQNEKYINFILKNKQTIQSTDKSKRFRIFNKMALFVKTRDHIQCRNHHRKMIQNYKSIDAIVDYLSYNIVPVPQLNIISQKSSRINQDNNSFFQNQEFSEFSVMEEIKESKESETLIDSMFDIDLQSRIDYDFQVRQKFIRQKSIFEDLLQNCFNQNY